MSILNTRENFQFILEFMLSRVILDLWHHSNILLREKLVHKKWNSFEEILCWSAIVLVKVVIQIYKLWQKLCN